MFSYYVGTGYIANIIIVFLTILVGSEVTYTMDGYIYLYNRMLGPLSIKTYYTSIERTTTDN